jgi:hypothetical protein
VSDTVVPQLVYDRETGKICIMIKSGAEMAVHELPDDLATADKVALQKYMEGVVPGMMDGLKAKRTEKRQTTWKKAKDD